jgi:hypothetical protein
MPARSGKPPRVQSLIERAKVHLNLLPNLVRLGSRTWFMRWRWLGYDVTELNGLIESSTNGRRKC